MNKATETLLGCGDALPGAPAQPETGDGCEAGWMWSHATLTGTRHQQHGGVCEDAVRVRVLAPAGEGAAGASGAIHAALADGVSAGARGDICAQALTTHYANWDPAGSVSLYDWVAQYAEVEVQAALRKHTSAVGASTGAAVWIDEDGVMQANRIGDSRVYGWMACADGSVSLRQLLPDQTMAYMGYAPTGARGDQPAHMCGNNNVGRPQFTNKMEVSVAGGFLLCSDGLHRFVSDTTLALRLQTFAEFARDRAGGAAARWSGALVREAQALGSDDDVSVLVAMRLDIRQQHA